MNANVALIIDDDPDICDFIKEVAEKSGLEPKVVADHSKFREDYRRCQPAVVVSDLQMPDTDGIEVLRYLADQGSKAKIILLSGFDLKVIASARKLGTSLGLHVLGALQKPLKVADLKELFEMAKTESSTPTVKELESAIERGELETWYQPKLRLHGDRSGEVLGFEALARWPHPRLGMVSPDMFIFMAEQEGLITALTELVFDQTLAQLVAWRAAGHKFELAVNISAMLLDDLNFPDRLARKVRDSGADPSHVILEITETGAMKDEAKCMDILTRLRLKGFHLSIDDFGTGYSSLVELHQMPFSELKIDRSFIMEVESNEQLQVIVLAIVGMAHSLGLSVCAEGVEGAWAWAYLDSLEVEKAQGYFMSKPLAVKDIPAWLESWTAENVETRERKKN